MSVTQPFSAVLTLMLALATLALIPAAALAQSAHTDPALDTAAFASLQIDDYFPPVAIALGAYGEARLHCVVALDGAGDCSVLSETPANLSFGAAALALSHQMHFRPATENGRPVAGGIDDITVNFPNENHGPLPIAPAMAWAVRSTPAHEVSGGRALIDCAVRSDKRLDCGVEVEAPESEHVGEHALHLLQSSWRPDAPGVAAGAIYRIPVEILIQRSEQAPTPPPMFSQRPTDDQLSDIYPWRNGQEFAEGHVVLSCTIRADAHLDCRVLEEHPNGVDFGAAALRASHLFVVAADQLGRPGIRPGDAFTIPFTFTHHPRTPTPRGPVHH